MERPHPFAGDRVIQPLNCAIVEGNKPILEFLLNWEAPHMGGESVIRDRFQSGSGPDWIGVGSATDAETVQLLVNARADVNARCAGFPTPMGKAFTPVFFAIAAAGTSDAKVQWIACMPGMTPLHEAAFKGNIEVVRALCDLKADPRIRNTYGMTPLEVARQRGLEHVERELQSALAKWPAERSAWWCCAAATEEHVAFPAIVAEEFVPDEKDTELERKPSKALSMMSTEAGSEPDLADLPEDGLVWA